MLEYLSSTSLRLVDFPWRKWAWHISLRRGKVYRADWLSDEDYPLMVGLSSRGITTVRLLDWQGKQYIYNMLDQRRNKKLKSKNYWPLARFLNMKES